MNLNIAFFLFFIFLGTAARNGPPLNCPCLEEFPNCNTGLGILCAYTLEYDTVITFTRTPPKDVLNYVMNLAMEAVKEGKIPDDERIIFHGTDLYDKRNAALIFVCRTCQTLKTLKRLTVNSFRAYIMSVYALRQAQNYVYRMEFHPLEQRIYFVPKMRESTGKKFFEIGDACYGTSAIKIRHFYRPHFSGQAVCFIEHTMTSTTNYDFKLVSAYVDDGLISEKPNLANSHVTRFGPPCRIIFIPGMEKYDTILSCACRSKACVDFTESKKRGAFCLHGAEFVLPKDGKITTYVRYQWLQKGEQRCVPELTITPDKKVLAFRAFNVDDTVSNKSILIFKNEGDSDISQGIPPQLSYVNMTFLEKDFVEMNKIVHWILRNEYLYKVKPDGTCDNGNFFISPRFAKEENEVQGQSLFPCLYEWSIFQNKRYYPVPMINAYPVRHLILDGMKSTVFVGMRKQVNIKHREFDVYATLTYDDKNAKPTQEIIDKTKKFYSICPQNINETHIVLNATSSLQLCGVYIKGIGWLKGPSLGWAPLEIKFKPLEKEDLDEYGMKHNVNTIQCAFKQPEETMCTCPSEMGECHKTEYYAKIHTLRFGAVDNQTNRKVRVSWGFEYLRDWKRDHLRKHLGKE